MKRSTLLLFFISLALSCAPKLSIVHEDPAYDYVLVRVDGETTGFVEYGQTLSVRVTTGFHEVSTTPRGSEANPWCEGGNSWILYVDRKAEVTLLPDLMR